MQRGFVKRYLCAESRWRRDSVDFAVTIHYLLKELVEKGVIMVKTRIAAAAAAARLACESVEGERRI